jgi:2',3'-cyclic-nucleotide 2'-phosphodiesterase (5'-nucleotidase family)
MVDMSRPEGTASSVPPDAELSRLAEAWRVKVDAVLGEPIGWADKGFEKASGEMGRWIGDAWRAELGADVAIVNGSGLRQNLPRGTITKAIVWSILPFDNRIVVVRLPGSALVENLRNKEAVAAGVARGPDGTFTLPGGQPIDPQHVYSLVTVDYLYLGGDHFTFKERAVSANETEIDWREPVIAWTKKQHTTKDAPLEGLLR